jgi:hypothetical protein
MALQLKNNDGNATPLRMPRADEFRCVCGRIVRIANTYVVSFSYVALMHAEPTNIKTSRRMCVHCKRKHEGSEQSVLTIAK